MIESNIDLDDVEAKINRLLKGTRSAGPLMRIIQGDMEDEVEENFRQEGRPKWLGFKYAPNEKRGGSSAKLLQHTGRLASSIQGRSTENAAIVGTNTVYAEIQHKGGKTRPHLIKPRNKKALAFNGRVLKSVNHPGSNIPARPFLMITPSGEVKILSHASQYFRNLID